MTRPPPPAPPRMPADTAADRRQHPRQPGEGRYLLINGVAARLVDWSLGGLGVELEVGSIPPAPGTAITARIRRADGHTWTDLGGTVRRSQGRMLGIALDYGVDEGFDTLMDLLAHRPA